MANTSASVVNEALQLIASQYQISALGDGSAAGNAAGVLYAPCVNMMLRLMDPAFARIFLTLASARSPPEILPWLYEYTYPADCLRLRSVRPGTASLDPAPVRAQVATDIISSVPTKVILTNLSPAYALYTTSLVGVGQEALWDFGFEQAVVRRLANPLAMALAGRPDFAKELLEEAQAVAQMAELADEV